jgi:hypothetical protein
MCNKFIICWNLYQSNEKFEDISQEYLLQFHRLDLQNNDNHQFALIVRVHDERKHLMDVFDCRELVDQV